MILTLKPVNPWRYVSICTIERRQVWVLFECIYLPPPVFVNKKCATAGLKLDLIFASFVFTAIKCDIYCKTFSCVVGGERRERWLPPILQRKMHDFTFLVWHQNYGAFVIIFGEIFDRIILKYFDYDGTCLFYEKFSTYIFETTTGLETLDH